MRLAVIALAIAFWSVTDASGQAAAVPPAWDVYAAVNTYFPPYERNYVQPTITLDRDWLHLEGRFNYENRDAGSLWAGYHFGGGNALEWDVTPMVGGVFGATNGVAPGYVASLRWRALDLYSEGEYVFDAGDLSESFFFSWSEASIVPVNWFRFGLAAQHTPASDGRDVQRGLLVSFAYKKVEATTYVFNPDERRPTFMFSLTVGF